MEINPLLQDVILISITSVAAIIIIKWASYLLKKTGERWEIDLTAIHVTQDIIKYGVFLIAFSLILREIGIDITGIFISFGIIGIAIGFASRDIIANFISGMLILFDKNFKVGDTIEISNHKGKVNKLGLRTTNITTPDNSVITIPNSSFSKNPYVNHTYMNRRRVDLNITIPYSFDLEKLSDEIIKIVNGFEWVMVSPKPNVMLIELSDVGAKAKITAWASDPWKVDDYRSIMAEELKKILVTENE
jgi:small conductance mechanosensitive channel